MPMPLFSFLQPQQQQSFPPQQQNQSYAPDQQGQNLLDPGSAQLAQSDPYAMAGRQALGSAFHQAGQMVPPGAMPQAQPGMPQDADAFLQQKGVTPQALAAGLMQPQQSPWTMEASYPKPNFGGKQGVWGG